MDDIGTDGFRLLRGVVSGAVVDDLRARIDEVVEHHADGVDVRAGTVWIKDAGVLGAAAVDALMGTPDVMNAVRQLLGPGAVPIGAVMRNPIGTTSQQALHVDWAGPIEPGADQQVQAMFFLDDIDDHNGPTRLVPGTHRSRALPPRALAANPASTHPQEVSATGCAGDVLVFSSHMWHSGTANPSGRPRRVITATYRRSDL